MFFFFDRFRLFIMVLGLLCLTSICSNYIIINFTFICMKEDMRSTRIDGNGTVISIYDYSNHEKKAILWAVAAGTILGVFPINYIYTKYGAKYPFFLAGLLSSIATVFLPFAAGSDFVTLLALRFVQGLAYAADFGAIGLICVRWAPLRETAIFISVLTAFTPLASVVTNAISGVFCESASGWQGSYTIHGIFGCLIFVIWICFYTDFPQDAQQVSYKEIQVIQKGKSRDHAEKNCAVPYKAILRNPVILCVWWNAFVEMTSTILLTTYSPIYFHEILKYDAYTAGFLIASSIGIQIPFKFTAAVISDKLNSFSEIAKIRFFNTIAVGLAGVFYCVLALIPADIPWLSVIIFALIHSSMSCNCAAFYKCGTLVSRQFAHIVIATIQFMKCVALFSAPLLVSSIVSDESVKSQWNIVWFVMATSMITANFISYFIFTVEPAEFTKQSVVEEARSGDIMISEIANQQL